MKPKTLLMGVTALAGVALGGVEALADWNPGQPAKWVQLPDPQGLDVLATYHPGLPFGKVIADDWLCTSTDPVTDFHIWGSWLGNQVNPNVTFRIQIRSDVPAGVDAPYSHPNTTATGLIRDYTFQPGSYVARIYGTGTEQFYDPNINQIIGTDNEIWQYNFTNLPDPFVQQGTASAPKVYWLAVQAIVPGPESFGWKTTIQPSPILDDATFADTDPTGLLIAPPSPAPPPVYWMDMHYPILLPNHFPGDSINMAFVITPEPSSLALLAAAGLLLIVRRR
jgi:hypothetical protein